MASIKNHHSLLNCIAMTVVLAFVSACEPQDVGDPFGYEKLRRELGEAMPDGSGVEVQLVEARGDVTEMVDGVETKVGTAFAPNPVLDEFLDKKIRIVPDFSRLHSGHANGVGRKFFGRLSSMAPAIEDIEAWESMTWLDSVLNMGRGFLPVAQSARVANHSWVGNAEHPELPGTRNVEALRRLDWLIETDDFIQVAGFNGSGDSPLFASAWNAIVVSHVVGAYAAGSAPVGQTDYPPGRIRPDIVAEETYPSSAAARVSSAAALLVQAARMTRNPSRALDRSVAVNRAGVRVFAGESSEVIRAALMAGATAVPTEGEASEKPVGLHPQYGAGRLDVHNSYQVIVGGESDSREDGAAQGSVIPTAGFDYDDAFGGSAGSNVTATYAIAGRDAPVGLTAALIWNARILPGRRLAFGQGAQLFSLVLQLYDVSDPGGEELIASSKVWPDNRQFLRHPLEANRNYELRIAAASGQPLFSWDYGLAWRMAP
ncbi:MAG: hypothetical protein ACN4GT_02695 [Gammaproteobacteria bacterium]